MPYQPVETSTSTFRDTYPVVAVNSDGLTVTFNGHPQSVRDLSNPPVQISGGMLQGISNTVAIAGTVTSTPSGVQDVLVTGQPVQVRDLSNPSVQLSGGTLQGISSVVSVSQSGSWVVDVSDTQFDVRDTSNPPVQVSGGTLRGISDTVVVAVSGQPVQVRDLSNSPVQISGGTLQGISSTVTVSGTVTAVASGVQDVLVTGQPIQVRDLSNPPTQVSGGTLQGISNVVSVGQSGSWSVGIIGGALDVRDTSNPPVQISGGTLQGISGTVTIAGTVIATPSGVQSVTVTGQPLQTRDLSNPPIQVSGGTLQGISNVVSVGQSGAWSVDVLDTQFDVRDLSNPPVQISGGILQGISSTVLVSVSGQPVQTRDLSNPPVQISGGSLLGISNAVSSAQSGVWDVGLVGQPIQTRDLSNPPVQISGGTLQGISGTVAVSGTVISTPSGTQNVLVTGQPIQARDLSNPPVQISGGSLWGISNTVTTAIIDYTDGHRAVVDKYGRLTTRLGGTAVDAFGRFRCALPFSVFESQLQYDLDSLRWETVVSGSGSVTHLPNESSAQLYVSTASGDRAMRTTREYFRYQAGKSQFIVTSGVLGAAKAGVKTRVGLFDDRDGVFFEVSSSGLSVVVRSSVSGSVVESVVAQSAFNVDKLDGTGVSGLNLDTSKQNVYAIDFAWLGVGHVRFGVMDDSEFLAAHIVSNENVSTAVWCRSPNLPVRYEIVNTATTASPTTMKQTCCAVFNEGGQDIHGFHFSADNGVTLRNISTATPIISIRASATFNGITNRSVIHPKSAQLMVTTADNFLYRLVQGGTLTGASFLRANAFSAVDVDTSATAISGGRSVLSGYIASASSRAVIDVPLESRVPLTLDSTGANPVIFSLVCQIIGAGSGNTVGSIDWEEFR